MTVKVTFFMNAIRAATYTGVTTPPTGVAGYRGLSESWYSAKVFDSQDLYDTCTYWQSKRVPMLPRNSTIVAFRQQEVGNLGRSVLYKVPRPGVNAFIQDQSEAALKYKVRSTTTSAERTAVIAMVPDDIIIGGVYAGGEGDWLSYVNQFFNHIRDNWQMRIIDQSVPTYSIATIDADGNVVTNEATAFVAGAKVQVLRSKTEEDNTGSGVFYVETVTNPTHFKLRGWTFGATTKGSIRTYVITYNSVNVSTNHRANPEVGTRKIGRPFGESRGKASKKR